MITGQILSNRQSELPRNSLYYEILAKSRGISVEKAIKWNRTYRQSLVPPLTWDVAKKRANKKNS